MSNHATLLVASRLPVIRNPDVAQSQTMFILLTMLTLTSDCEFAAIHVLARLHKTGSHAKLENNMLPIKISSVL